MKFEVTTPLSFTVRTTESYWKRLLTKHPDLEDLENFVQQTLIDPDEIQHSKQDENILLFYRSLKAKRWVVAVTRRIDHDGFLITAYQTNAIKEGELLWHK